MRFRWHLSTQLFNDRLTINGSVDVATNAAVNASDNIVGEFDIDYKITKNGKFRIKTFNHVNNEMLYENSPIPRDLGVFYKEEFNTWVNCGGVTGDPYQVKGKKNPVA